MNSRFSIYVFGALISLSLILHVIQYRKIHVLQHQLHHQHGLSDIKSDVHQKHNHPDHESIELAVLMGRMQRHFTKLWWSGLAENDSLKSFYIHEMEEILEAVAEADIMEDSGVNVSQFATQIGLPGLESLENKIKNDNDIDAFKEAYISMINTCNTCHQHSGYGFVQIDTPKFNVFDNQIFAVNP